MDRAWIRLRIHLTPIHLTGLQFHDALRAVDAAEELVDKRHLCSATHPEANRAVVEISVHGINRPRHNLEILAIEHGIHPVKPVHEIMCDPLAVAAMLAQNTGLET